MPCAHSSATSRAAPGRVILGHSESSAPDVTAPGLAARAETKYASITPWLHSRLKHLAALRIDTGIAITLRDNKASESMRNDVTHVAQCGVRRGQRLEAFQRVADTAPPRDDEQLGDVEVAVGHARPVDTGRWRAVMAVAGRCDGRRVSGRGVVRECPPAGHQTYRQAPRQDDQQYLRRDDHCVAPFA